MEFSDLHVDQIVEAALAEGDEARRWEYVCELRSRVTRKVFDVAKDLCLSDEPARIQLGGDVLALFGAPEWLFREDSIPVLLKAAEVEKSVDSLEAIIFGLGRMEDASCYRRLLDFKNHPSEEIRFAVAYGLCWATGDAEIAALIELSADNDPDVRDWATFGLGQSEADSREVRDALFNRLGETVGDELTDEIRGEALVGLALRKDERVIEPLMRELNLESVGALTIEAASEMADKRLCDGLLKIKEWWDPTDSNLREAIANCCGPRD